MSRYDAILFDMDGTLLDTVDDIRDALNQTLEEFGYPTHVRDDVKRFIGKGAHELIRRALPDYAQASEIEAMLTVFRAQYKQRVNAKTHPFPGVLPMLTALDEAGLKLAIISNKSDDKVRQLAKEHFGSLIHIAVGAQDGIPMKPEPDMLNFALQRVGTTPERTLYIGDAPTDFLAAENAGMDCILVHWGYGDPRELSLLSPLFFAADPAELPMLILREQEDFS
ncbi:MAG TPA: HAD family hydrolase [Candidatus Limiplasma sp.]|nr:HAD family hydrolase [Candidatus Limiplasma sp.]